MTQGEKSPKTVPTLVFATVPNLEIRIPLSACYIFSGEKISSGITTSHSSR